MGIGARNEILSGLGPDLEVKMQVCEGGQALADPVKSFMEQVSDLADKIALCSGVDELAGEIAETLKAEKIASVMLSGCDSVSRLGLSGKMPEVAFKTAESYGSRDMYVRAAFDFAEAGITGADFAIAETGTLALIQNHDNPRLISLTPPLHLAVVPASRIVSTYEEVLLRVGGDIKGQLTMITGPSMTADIQATMFRGMHGPGRLMILILDDR